MRSILVMFLLLYFYSTTSFGQNSSLSESLSSEQIKWSEGSITKNDGRVLRGSIKYNDRTGILSYKIGDETISLTSRSVSLFDFYDDTNSKHRQFLTLEYDDPKTGGKSPQFFEVIRELKLFAVLAKSDPVEINHIVNNNSNKGIHFKNKIEVDVEQTETIYILDQNGVIEPYCRAVKNERGRVDKEKKSETTERNMMINRNILKRLIGEQHWQELHSYAKREYLSFDVKGDLLRILNYYAEMMAK